MDANFSKKIKFCQMKNELLESGGMQCMCTHVTSQTAPRIALNVNMEP